MAYAFVYKLRFRRCKESEGKKKTVTSLHIREQEEVEKECRLDGEAASDDKIL